MKLKELRENPRNPSFATDEDIKRLAGKLKRVPLGLTAMRIAYVTDDPDGGKMVISGNKRLRVLKAIYGEDEELPDDYFQDVTAMSEAERHEFIVTANVSDGQWNVELLLEQYDISELQVLLSQTDSIFGDITKYEEPIIETVQSTNEISSKIEEPVKSVVGYQYKFGLNILSCVDEIDCDRLRQMYTKMVTGSTEDFENQTPIYSKPEENELGKL